MVFAGPKPTLVAKATESLCDTSKWPIHHINIMMREYGLEEFPETVTSADDLRRGLPPRIQALSVTDLLSLNQVARDGLLAPGEEVHHDARMWAEGVPRVFLSHKAEHRQYVHEVADALSERGVAAFVAHDSIEVDADWQSTIESALATMDALVAILHEDFARSAWTQQEVGWALGRGVPVLQIKHGEDPVGFGSRRQAGPFPAGAQECALFILDWLSRRPEFGEALVSARIRVLRDSASYVAAETAAMEIARLSHLTPAQWEALSDAVVTNDQVHGGVLPTRVLRAFFARHGKTMPSGSAPAASALHGSHPYSDSEDR